MEKEQKINNNISNCKYFVMRKKRFCRMTVKSGFDYCGEHQPKSDEPTIASDSRLRIPCPLDSKHTCFANKLSNHLKKCNAQKGVSLPYIITNINTGENSNISNTSTRQLSNVSTNEILVVIKKVNKLYEDIIKNSVTKKILHHEVLTEEINIPEYGSTTRKHLVQTSSIIAHLKNANLLQNKTCFIEFGAGKGQLSFWLSKVINPLQDSSILLVERASLRHKLDNKLDKTTNNIHRIRADIADLVLSKTEIVLQSEKIVGITKHLCGEATDLALRCLINGMKQRTNIQGLVMAFCCHHRCQWPNYVGQQFFERNNLTREEFDIICGLVSWATCGSGLSREARKNMQNNLKTIQENNQNKTRDEELGLAREERENVGKRCKLLIDYGRLFYLDKHNFSCKLHYYVEQDVTLENVCIVAEKINTNI